MKKGREDLQPYVDSAGILGSFPPPSFHRSRFFYARVETDSVARGGMSGLQWH
jgi:hypothetical protein